MKKKKLNVTNTEIIYIHIHTSLFACACFEILLFFFKKKNFQSSKFGVIEFSSHTKIPRFVMRFMCFSNVFIFCATSHHTPS